MKNVKYPNMREELLGHLNALSDAEYQQRVWVEGGAEGNVEHDEFDYAVHFLFDDTKLSEDPYSLIGWVLKEEAEAHAIKRLVGAIESIFQKHGTNLTDAEYIHLTEWQEVLSAAKAAVAVVKD